MRIVRICNYTTVGELPPPPREAGPNGTRIGPTFRIKSLLLTHNHLQFRVLDGDSKPSCHSGTVLSIERVLIAHGTPVATDGATFVRRALSWLR